VSSIRIRVERLAPGDSSDRDDKADKLERLYELVENVKIAMMTTRRRDGSLVSRPMATQRRADGADFWFVAAQGTPKLEEIAADPNVNLSYMRPNGREWVSVSGAARISRDRAKIRELYEPDWKMWFGDEGGARNGGPDDPRMILIGVEARSAHFLAPDKAAAVVLFEYVKGLVTRKEPDLGEVETVSAREFND
jgi:general stress protein 26